MLFHVASWCQIALVELPLFFSLLFSQVSPKTYYFVSSGLGFLYHPQLVMRRQRRNLVLKDSHRLLNQIPWKRTKGRQGLSGMFNCKLVWVVQNLKCSWFIRTMTNMQLHASRFSQSSSGSLSINGKGDLEPVRPSFMDDCSISFERINCYLFLYYFSVLNFFCFFFSFFLQSEGSYCRRGWWRVLNWHLLC